jgi:hypothetical protein
LICSFFAHSTASDYDQCCLVLKLLLHIIYFGFPYDPGIEKGRKSFIIFLP